MSQAINPHPYQPAPARRPRNAKRDRRIGGAIGGAGYLLLIIGASVAASDYQASSTTRRGQSLEELWHGAAMILGTEQPADLGDLSIGRGLAALGLVVLLLWIGWKVHVRRSSRVTPAPVPGPMTGHHQPPAAALGYPFVPAQQSPPPAYQSWSPSSANQAASPRP